MDAVVHLLGTALTSVLLSLVVLRVLSKPLAPLVVTLWIDRLGRFVVAPGRRDKA
ncbi:MAG: hypothetical protein LCH73_16290 [Proteobacteria bacterium]|nr:hypothetical protein [Pseudomonadota bacterium]